MNNQEDGGKIESSNEQIPSRENILAEIHKLCKGGEVIKERANDDGIYLLEVIESGEKPGESTLYIYQRKGKFGINLMDKTSVEKIYMMDDIPYRGEVVSEYDETTGEWAIV